ncbi:unnamed protein product, partial [Allacma fusca]
IEIEDIEETVTSIHDTVTTTVEPPPAAPCTGPVVDPTEVRTFFLNLALNFDQKGSKNYPEILISGRTVSYFEIKVY